MNANSPTAIDNQLFELLVMSLTKAGYAVEQAEFGGLPAVLAENPDNVVLATTTVTVRDLVLAEAALSQALVERITEGSTGSKRWDAYVAVLTSQAAEANIGETLFGLTYNLRHVRRLVKVAVDPTIAGVGRALRALLPLAPDGSFSSLDVSPLDALTQRLVEDGIEPEAVKSALARFRSTSSDALLPSEESQDV